MGNYVQDRNEAFFSLNRQKIVDFCNKYGEDYPENEIVFWTAVYKCICNIKDAPADLKEHAEFWLTVNGMSPEIILPHPSMRFHN